MIGLKVRTLAAVGKAADKTAAWVEVARALSATEEARTHATELQKANPAPATVLVPPVQGADPSAYVSQSLQGTPILQFSGDTAYGQMGTGMTIWALGAGYTTVMANMPTSTIKNLT